MKLEYSSYFTGAGITKDKDNVGSKFEETVTGLIQRCYYMHHVSMQLVKWSTGYGEEGI